ncbi:MAG TPA: hypothetical protein VH592_09465 [Gemmataceae bacterium]
MWIIITNVWPYLGIERHPMEGWGNSIQSARPIGPFEQEEDAINYLESHGWQRIDSITDIKCWQHEMRCGIAVVRQIEAP